MNPVAIIVILICVLVACISSIVFLVRAFQTTILWGLGVLLIPFVNVVFLICHWNRAKGSFLTSFVASAVAAGVFFTSVDMKGDQWKKFLAAISNPEVVTKEINEKRHEIEVLEGQFSPLAAHVNASFQSLNARRSTLKAGDTKAVEQFNVEIAAYQAKNAELKAVKQELDNARHELEDLLAKRSLNAAAQAKAQQRSAVQ